MKFLLVRIILISVLFPTIIQSSAQLVALRSNYIPFEIPDELRIPGDDGYISMIKKNTRVNGSGWNVARYIITIIKYDIEGKKVKENVLSGGDPVYTAFFADLKKSGDNLWFIYIEPSRGANIGNIKAVIINSATLETSEPILLSAESQVGMKVGSISSLHISLLSSPAANRHCLFINNGGQEFYLSSFDKNFKQIWAGRQTIPGIEGRNIKSAVIDNAGDIFVTSIKKGNASISIFSAQGKAEHKKLSFGEIEPSEINFYDTDEKEGLGMAGVYNDGSDNISGVYRATLNKQTLTIENLATSDFPKQIIERTGRGFAKTGSKKFGIIKDFLVCNIMQRKNSTATLVIECKRWHPAPNTFASITSSLITATFTENGIVFSDIPRDGLIPDRVVDPQYYAAVCKDDFMLFYLDHESNLGKSLEEKQTLLNGGKDAVLVVAYVGYDGKINRRVKVTGAGITVSESISNYLANECKNR